MFRRFSKGSKLSENRLTDQTVALLIKEYLNLAGIDSQNYSGHSLRSGFATSAAESGVRRKKYYGNDRTQINRNGQKIY